MWKLPTIRWGQGRRQPTVSSARSTLFVVWFVGSFIIIAFFAAQTMFGVFGVDVTKAWGWLVPHLAPSLSVILSGYVATSMQDEPRDATLTKPWVAPMAILWSVGYLGILFCVMLFEPVFPESLFVVQQNSNAFLGVLQGFVSAFLAVFFMTGQQSIDRGLDGSGDSATHAQPMVPAE